LALTNLDLAARRGGGVIGQRNNVSLSLEVGKGPYISICVKRDHVA
jgi:hypothetical protein